MTSSASVLVCNDPRSVNQDKLRHASEWGVPAVTRNWLWDSIQAGQKKSFEPYIVRRQLSQSYKDAEKRQNGSHSDHTGNLNLTATDGESRSGSEVVEVKRNTPLAVGKESTPDVPQPKGVERHTKPTSDNNILKEKQQIPQKRTVSQSRSPSPQKDQSRIDTSSSSLKRQETDQSTASAFDLAVNGLLKQARAASSRTATDSGEQSDQPRRRRKPLLGRAPSLNSSRPAEHSVFSRASSIDTLNDDGCGSGAESVATDRITASRANSRGEQSFTSLFGTRFEFGAENNPENGREDEEQEPPMTQLNYEDPDAVAMRQKFLQTAGKLVEKDPQAGQVVNEVRELEDVGWGTGRRTRKAAAEPADGLEEY